VRRRRNKRRRRRRRKGMRPRPTTVKTPDSCEGRV
jgi:hypothetical protein